jgi:hypothetical protein
MEDAIQLVKRYFKQDPTAGQRPELAEVVEAACRHHVISLPLGVRGKVSFMEKDSGGHWHLALHVPDVVIGTSEDSQEYMLPPFQKQRASLYNYYELLLSVLACASGKPIGSIALYHMWDDAKRIPLSYKGNGVLRFLQGRQHPVAKAVSKPTQTSIYSTF